MTEIRPVSISKVNRNLVSSFDEIPGDWTPNIMKAINFYLNKKGFLRKTSPNIWAKTVEWKEFFNDMSEADANKFLKKFNTLDKMFRDVVEKYE